MVWCWGLTNLFSCVLCLGAQEPGAASTCCLPLNGGSECFRVFTSSDYRFVLDAVGSGEEEPPWSSLKNSHQNSLDRRRAALNLHWGEPCVNCQPFVLVSVVGAVTLQSVWLDQTFYILYIFWLKYLSSPHPLYVLLSMRYTWLLLGGRNDMLP